MDGNDIRYIGKSKNLNNRWRNDGHHRYEQAETEVRQPVLSWFTCPESQIHELETKLIHYWKGQGQADWNNTPVPEYAPSLGLFDTVFNFFGWLFGTKLGWATLVGLWFVFSAEQPPAPPIPQGHTAIYSAPTLASKVAKSVPDDATVVVQRCVGDWVQVRHEAVTGWVPWSEFDGRDVCP